MRILGQFRDADRPDQFVWLRGFETWTPAGPRSRVLRRTGLGGHPDAANATMVAVDDVLLLRPVEPGSGLSLRSLRHRDDPRSSAVVVLIAERSAADVLHPAVAAMSAFGGSTLGCYETDRRENNFPRLPVRLADVAVWFGGLATADHLDEVPGALEDVPGGDALTLCAWCRPLGRSWTEPDEDPPLSKRRVPSVWLVGREGGPGPKEHDMTKYLLAYHGGQMAKTGRAGQGDGGVGRVVHLPRGRRRRRWRTSRHGDDAGRRRRDVGGRRGRPGQRLQRVTASDLDAAVALAKGCPILQAGGSIEVAETIEM